MTDLDETWTRVDLANSPAGSNPSAGLRSSQSTWSDQTGVRHNLLNQIAPSAFVFKEQFGKHVWSRLLPEEHLLHISARSARIREFSAGRKAARDALADLGHPPTPILSDPNGAPLWPNGFIGSITHSSRYCGVAVARSASLRSVGIDAEPNLESSSQVARLVARPFETDLIASFSDFDRTISWLRLLFSCKESVYKALYPITGKWLGYHDLIVKIDHIDGTFTAEVVPDDVVPRSLRNLHGRWNVSEGMIFTALAIRAKEAC